MLAGCCDAHACCNLVACSRAACPGSKRTFKMPMGPQLHEQRMCEALGVASQQDVCSPPSHVGGNGHPSRHASLGYQLRLTAHILRLCIEQRQLDFVPANHTVGLEVL